jgi:CelD/BcsL family acetyltransferase involved in cellulose biosynthesis
MGPLEVRTNTDWNTLEQSWRGLWRESPNATVFQSWDWIYSFWKNGLAAGEPLLLSFHDGDRCVAIAPLTRLGTGTQLRRLTLMGGDYCDILATSDASVAAANALFEWLSSQKGKWDMADFKGLPANAVLLRATEFSGLLQQRLAHQVYPAIDLPTTWSEYMELVGKKLRNQIGRYYVRRLEREHGVVCFRAATGETVLDDMETLFRLHQERWEGKGLPGIFSTEPVRLFHRELATGLSRSGNLRLYVLEVAGEPVGAFYGFAHGSEMIYYLGGFSERYSKHGPLKLLIAHAIRAAIEEGLQVFDFIKGEEDYKNDWRAVSRPTYRLLISRRSLRPQLVITALRMQPTVKQLRRKLKRT